MKTTFYILVVLFFYCSACAQQFTATLGDTLKYNAIMPSIGHGNNYYTLIRDRKLTSSALIVSIEKKSYESKAVGTLNKIKLTFPTIVLLEDVGGKLYLIYQDIDRDRNMQNVMAAEIDTAAMQIGTPKAISDFSKIGYTARMNMWGNNYVTFFKCSPDGTKFFFLESLKESELYIGVFDSQLNPVWERKESVSAGNKDLVIKDACVDNNGNVYCAYQVMQDKKSIVPASSLNRMAIYGSEKMIIDQALDIGDGIIQEITMKPSDNKTVMFGGYYYTDNKERLQGAFAGMVDTDNRQTTPIKKAAFPKELIVQLERDGWASTKAKKYGTIPAISPKLLTMADGTPVLAGEFRDVVTSSTGKGFAFSGSVVIVRFEDTITFTRVPKYRVSTSTILGDSYTAFPFRNKVIVFYNDDDDNMKKDISLAPDNSRVYKNVVLVAAVVDADGSVKRNIIVDLQKENFMAITDNIVRETEYLFLVPFVKVKGLGGISRESKMAKVEVQ